MPQFPHLQFIQQVTGEPRINGRGSLSPQSIENQADRPAHVQRLTAHVNQVKTAWVATLREREDEGLPELEQNVIPVFLRVDPKTVRNDFNLHHFEIEVISEEEDGYILGAAYDDLQSLEEKIAGFAGIEHGTGKVAALWSITQGDRTQWKPQRVLSEELLARWPAVEDDTYYSLEVSIAFDYPIKAAPDPSKRGGEKRLAKYHALLEERDDLRMNREHHFEQFIGNYGTLESGLVDNNDSFSCEVNITGKGLKDLVYNYPYVFEVVEKEEIRLDILTNEGGQGEGGNINPPNDNAIEIGVIDSGIMEGHAYLASAVKGDHSLSYLDDPSTADHVRGGGHGTKVAGRILYPDGITQLPQPYQLPFFVRNLRVLDEKCSLLNRYPAQLMEDIVNDNPECKIFNLSINSRSPFRKKHMSTWAASLDKLIHEQGVLFVVSSGNLSREQITNHYLAERSFPDYLNQPNCKLANPAQSSFAIVVGSVNHDSFEDNNWASIGVAGEPSAFTRSGPGIWGKIKPDLVDYGGGLLVSKDGRFATRFHETTSPELIQSTMHGGNGVGKGASGTSFAAPRVTHIAGKIKSLYPEAGPNLIRTLLVHGARLPGTFFRDPTVESFAHLGYGIPSLARITDNSDHRVTFYNTGNLSVGNGHIYAIDLPEEIRSPGDDHEVLVEVTLAFSASVRRTRQQTKSYLASWLDWTPAKFGESVADFTNYTLKLVNGEATTYSSAQRNALGSLPWKLRRQNNHGSVKEMHRNNSSIQKDWAIVRSHELPETFCLSVQAHKGWDLTEEEVPYAIAVSFEFLGAELPIYQAVRIANQVEVEV